MSLMPRRCIQKRTLHAWSVHYSQTTNLWVATISRPDESVVSKVKYLYFSFPNERHARKFCQSYAPPKTLVGSVCHNCSGPANRNCRNCGAVVCERCSLRWGAQMVPKTYMSSATLTLRACKSCDWLSNAFCLALIQGRYQDALDIHATVRFRVC
jgi:hypothetical protein